MSELFALHDPSGSIRGTFRSSPTPERLLRTAWNLGDADRFAVIASGDEGWALALYRPGAVHKVLMVGPEGTRDLNALLTLAWLSLIDEGWSLRPTTQPG